MTHLCVRKLATIGSDNGLSPGRRQIHYLNQCWYSVNWSLGDKLQWNLNRNFCIFIQENAFECSSGKWRPSCLGLNVFRHVVDMCRMSSWSSLFSDWGDLLVIKKRLCQIVMFICYILSKWSSYNCYILKHGVHKSWQVSVSLFSMFSVESSPGFFKLPLLRKGQ